MTDFETHPAGTAARLAELEAALTRANAAIDPAAIREDALREAADSVRGMADFCKTMGDIVGSRALYSAAAALIGEMIGEKK